MNPTPAPHAAPEAPRTVHILRGGVPLCRFDDRVPREWPPGHAWTGEHADELPHANCPTCKLARTAGPGVVLLPFWRAGRKVGRTLYCDGALVGMVDTPGLAAAIVDAMNGARAVKFKDDVMTLAYRAPRPPTPEDEGAP